MSSDPAARTPPRHAWLLAALLLSGVPGCGGGCTDVVVTAEPAPAPAPGQPLVLQARATTPDGGPVAGLGLRLEAVYQDTGGTFLRSVRTDRAGRAELRLGGGVDALRPLPGDALLGWRAAFVQSDPSLDRRGDVCSARSRTVSVG